MEAAAFAIGGATTGLSVIGANRQNRAIDRAISAQKQAASIQKRQLEVRRMVAERQRERERQIAEGRIRVAGASQGIGAGSLDQFSFSNTLNALTDQNIIRFNTQAETARVLSGAQANITRLQSQRANPILAGFEGFLGGFQQGIQIQSFLNTQFGSTGNGEA